MRRALIVVLLLAAGCAAGLTTPEAEARRIASEVWSPYCPGRLLSDCTTRQADELRDDIEARLRDGESAEQVLAWLQENYGEQVLARPPSSGGGMAVWLVPAGAILGGGILLGGLLRRWSRPVTKAPPPVPEPGPLNDEERDRWLRRVREEVERDPVD